MASEAVVVAPMVEAALMMSTRGQLRCRRHRRSCDRFLLLGCLTEEGAEGSGLDARWMIASFGLTFVELELASGIFSASEDKNSKRVTATVYS